jgi:phosphoenolpyruvate-protein kinase (PTS system EI component)
MAPMGLPSVRSALAELTMEDCRAMAAAAVAADTAAEARAAIAARVR